MSSNGEPAVSAATAPRSRGGGHAMRRLLAYALLLAAAATMLAPFVWMVSASLKPLSEVELGNWIPHSWRFDNYPEVTRQVAFGKYYFNSVFIALWVTFLQVLTSSMAAYAFSRIQWPGRDRIFLLYLATLMIPGVVTMVPNYWVMNKLRLVNTYIGLIVPAAFSAYGTFLLRQFMLGIPTSMDEAAQMDGAGHWRVYWDVIMPLARPGLITLAIFTFMGAYQSFFWPLVMIKDDWLRTLPIGLLYFDNSFGQQTNLLMAASVMTMIPLIVLFVIGQRFFVRGIQLGAVKG